MKDELNGSNILSNYDSIRHHVKELTRECYSEKARGLGVLTILAADLMIYMLENFPRITSEKLTFVTS